MIQRRGRPSFSKDDEERLLAYMEMTRHFNVYYGAANIFHPPQYALSTSLTVAIDKLAEGLTGDPKFFWQINATAGPQSSNPEAVSARQERQLRWRELRRKY